MADRNKTPMGSSLDASGQVTQIVVDTTTQQVNTQSQTVLNSDISNPGDQAIAAENDSNARDVDPLKDLSFVNSDSKALNDNRNNRHKELLNQNKFAVRLKSTLNGDVVVFRVSPEISESRTAAYKALDPIHMPGAVQVYQNTAPRTWSVSGAKLISRNGEEAEENLALINQLRSWMMPFFGKSNTNKSDGYASDILGSPPEVLEFTAYSSGGEANGMSNIRKIPIVMTTMNLNYPTDVDYIKTAKTGQPFPAVTTVDMILVETHSPKQLSNFNLIDYRHGHLPGF